MPCKYLKAESDPAREVLRCVKVNSGSNLPIFKYVNSANVAKMTTPVMEALGFFNQYVTA